MSVERHYEQHETEETEVISLLPQEISDHLEEKTSRQLTAMEPISFNPQEDAAILQEIIDLSATKVKKLLSLDIDELLIQESEELALLKGDGEDRPIKVNDGTISLRDKLYIENLLASTIAKHQNTIQKTMKERRMLSGQMYGSLMVHQTQISRTLKSKRFSGHQLLDAMPAAREHLDMSQDMPRLEAQSLDDILDAEVLPVPKAKQRSVDDDDDDLYSDNPD